MTRTADTPEVSLERVSHSGHKIETGHGTDIGKSQRNGILFPRFQEYPKQRTTGKQDNQCNKNSVDDGDCHCDSKTSGNAVVFSAASVLGRESGDGRRQAAAWSQDIAVDNGSGIEGSYRINAQGVDAGLDQQPSEVKHGLLQG